MIKASHEKCYKSLIKRRDFLRGTTTAIIAALTAGCNNHGDLPDKYQKYQTNRAINPSSWWRKEGFVVHDTVNTKQVGKGVISACVNGSWQKFRIVKLPERFVDWSMKTRAARLERMIRAGGMDPRDLAGAHNACVATYGGPSRDSAVSLNTAYKGMGFAVHAEKLAETTQRINEERIRIESDSKNNPVMEMYAKVKFLAEFYRDTSSLDRTKQVSLELFTSPDFHTHTFLNMMANPITSASFLAFPTFEIRAVPQLLHPKDPGLSKIEKDLIAYTNTIHDFIHTGPGECMTCVYHVIELFDDTPNHKCKGKRIV